MKYKYILSILVAVLLLGKSSFLAGPTIHVKDLVKMTEAQLDALVGEPPLVPNPFFPGTMPDPNHVGPTITVTGLNSWLINNTIDITDLTKEKIYEVIDPKLTTFNIGQILKEEDYLEAVVDYKDFGGLTVKTDVGYAGYNGLNFSFLGFKGLENKVIVDEVNDKIYYSTSIMIPYMTNPNKLFDESRGAAAKGKFLHDGKSIFLEQQLQMEANENGNFDFKSAKISLPDFPVGSNFKMQYMQLEVGKDLFRMSGKLTQMDAFSADQKVDADRGAGAVEIEGDLMFANGGLKKIKVAGYYLKKPLGASGGYLQELEGTIGNLMVNESASNPWYFDGRGLVSIPHNTCVMFGKNYYIYSQEGTLGFNGNGRFSITSSASALSFPLSSSKLIFNPPFNVNIEIRDQIMGHFLGDLDIRVFNGNFMGKIGARMGVPRGIPIIGGMTLGGVKAGVVYVKDSHWEIRGEVYVVIMPEVKQVCWSDCIRGSWSHLHGCGWSGCSWHTHYWKTCFQVCTPKIPAVKANVGFSYHSTRNPSFQKLSVEQQAYLNPKYSWEIPLVYWIKDPENPGWWQFNQNWDILWSNTKRSSINKKGKIEKTGPDEVIDIAVNSDLETAIFRINYENENISELNAALIMPDGKILNLKDGTFPFGFTDQEVTGAATHNPDGREVFFLIHNVKSGSYKLVVENPAELGGIRAELASMTQKPESRIAMDPESSRGGEIMPGSYEINWQSIDKDSPDARITFMVDKNNTGNDGIEVGTGKLSDFNLNEPYNFDTDNIPSIRPGWYYGVIAVDDGRNPVQFSYTDNPIWIDRDKAPKPVESMRSRAGNNKIILEWDEPEGEFMYYNVHISKSDNFKIIDDSVMIEKGKNNTIINELENGQPYLVSVVTVDKDYLESAMMRIHRVTPTQIPGSTKPVIISEPIESATQGYNYVYIPLLFDADEHNPDVRKINKQDDGSIENFKTPIIWSIIEGPEGIKIDQSVGIVEWMPKVDQVGVHRVTIAATEDLEKPEGILAAALVNGTTTQTFEITVTPNWYVSSIDDKVYFASVPNMTAVSGQKYSYTPRISSNEEFSLELLSAPKDMELQNKNTLSWNVSEDSNGDYVHFKAVLNSSGEEVHSRYFLHVSSDKNKLFVGAELVKIERVADKVLLGWVGDGNKFQIQSSASLQLNQVGEIAWDNLGNQIEGNYINFISLESTDDDSMFYRVRVLE